jgi:hypothetical protein
MGTKEYTFEHSEGRVVLGSIYHLVERLRALKVWQRV